MSKQPNYRHIAYPDASPDDPGAAAPYVDLGCNRIHPDRYKSTEEARLEWEHMWTRSWSFAGITHDIPEVGDYFSFDLGPESFIVVRTGTGEQDVAAYYNVCPHRGNRISKSDFGSVGENGCFQCDFHGWKFGLDGQNVEVRDEKLFRPEQISHRPGLKQVRCGVWNSLVFVSMAEDGLSLAEHLDVMPEHMKDYPIDKFRVISDIQVCWDANWKTALDAFVEFYHADDVHPEVIPFSGTVDTQYDLFQNGLSRMIVPFGYVSERHDDRETVTEALKMYVQFFGGNPDDYPDVSGKDWRHALADTKRKWAKRHGYDHFDKFDDFRVTDDWNYFVFPNITINFFIEALLIQVFRPHPTDPQKSYYRAISMNLPVSNDQECVIDVASVGPEATSEPGWDGSIRPPIKTPEKLADFGAVLAQDARRVPDVQKGINSRAFDGFIFSESEVRIRHYLAEIDRYIGRR
jgi:phenylpropionate dioxygenase-like ring-hydroxylating dioxygenase large terminal subunit